jgi:hypothetical protein
MLLSHCFKFDKRNEDASDRTSSLTMTGRIRAPCSNNFVRWTLMDIALT